MTGHGALTQDAVPTRHPRRRGRGRRALAIAITLLACWSVSGTETARATGRSDGRFLEILVDNPADAARLARDVHARGGRVVSTAPGVMLVELPARADGRLTESNASFAGLDGVVRPPVRIDVRPENATVPERFGPTTGGADELTNALAWHAAGITGKGVRIGVIDFFDVTEYWQESEHGPAPIAGVTARCFDLGSDCTSDFFDGVDLGGEAHGVAVVEVIRDMAPDVEIFIGQATSTTDYRELLDWFVANGVDIINRSLGSRYDGPGDGRGPLGEIAADAASRGVLWVNSGGNNGENRYYRERVRLVDDRVAFGPDGDSTFLKFRGCVKLGGVRWATDWDLPAAQRTDYDIYLWESPTGTPRAGRIIDSGRLNQRAGAPPIEYLADDHCPALSRSLYLEVRWVAGDASNDVLEITDYDAGMANFTRADHSAAVSIVDSDDAGVIAVGALSAIDPTMIADYSSQGPTNDNRIAPDVAAPASFSSVAYGGIFSGSSAAAAVVAGGAAILLDSELAERGRPLGDLVRHTVIDRGDTGPDSVFGHGEFRLGEPPPEPAPTDPATFVALDVPERVLDTRPNRAIGPPELIGELWHGEILDLPILDIAGLPADQATAVAVNVVSVAADRPSHVQVLPANRATLGGFANLTIDAAGQTRANFAIVPVGDDGTISIHSIAEGHIVVDLLGWFRAAPDDPAAGRFVELASAQRVLDSRVDTPVVPLRSGEVRNVPLPSRVAPERIDALVVTVTATRSTGAGWVQAIPSDRADIVGTTATLNIAPGETSGNAAIVPVGPDGIALTSFIEGNGSTDVIVDVTGYITSEAAPASGSGRFVGLRPDRAYDSREGTSGPLGDEAVVVVDAGKVGVPTSAGGVVWNVSVAVASRPGHVVGWAADAAMPDTAIMAWIPAPTTRSSGAIIAVDAGRARFSAEDGPADLPTPLTHLITDVFGYFT